MYNFWLLLALKDKGLHHLFEIESKRAIEKAKADQQYEWSDKMLTLYTRHLISTKEIREELYRELHELYNEKIGFIEKDSVRKVRATEVMRAFTERTIRVTHPQFPVSPLTDSVDLNKENNHDPYSRYLELYALSFSQKGVAKIETLKQALQHIECCGDKPGMDVTNRTFILLATTALEYYLMGNHAEADTFYQRAIGFAQNNKQAVHIEILFNYFSNCIKLEDYRGATDLYEEHRQQIEANEKVFYRFLCLKGMCHLFLNQPAVALDCIPLDIQQRPHPQYYYFRIIQIIAYYLSDDDEAAMRECQNLIKVLRYQQEEQLDIDYLSLIRFLYKFVKAQTEVKSKRKEEMASLKTSITRYVTQKPMMGQYLPLLWLQKQLT